MNTSTLIERLKQLIQLHFSSDAQKLEIVSVYTQTDIMWNIKTALRSADVDSVDYIWNSDIDAAQHFLALEENFTQQKAVVLFMTQEQLMQDGTNFLNWKNRFELRSSNQKNTTSSTTPRILLVVHVSQQTQFPQELLRSISSTVLNWNVEW